MSLPAKLGPKPQRWALYVAALTLVALVWLLEVYVQASVPRTILEVMAIAGAFSAMRLWVRSNRGALDLDRERWHD